MTDSIRANNTSVAGGPLFAVDTINSTNYALTKITLGAENVDDGYVHSSNPLPITAIAPVSTFTVNAASGQTSSWIAGQDGPVSTFQVNSLAPTGVQSSFVNNFPSVQSTFTAGAAKTSTHIASQTGPISTFAVNTASPSGVQSTFSVNGGGNTSVYIYGQDTPVSTYSVNGGGNTSVFIYGQSVPVSTFVNNFPSVQSTFTAGAAKTSTHIASQTGPVSTFVVGNSASPSGVQSTFSVNGGGNTSVFIYGQSVPVSTYIVSVPQGAAEVSSLTAVNISTMSIVLMGGLENYEAVSSLAGTGSSQPFLFDSTRALVVRDLSGAAAAANPNSSWSMGSAAGSVPVSTFVVGGAKTSTHIASQTGPVSTYVVNGGSGGTSSVDQAAFTVSSGSGTPIMGYYSSSVVTVGHGTAAVVAINSSRVMQVQIPAAQQPISTFAVNTATPTGVQSTFSVNNLASSGTMSTFIVGGAKTSTHIASQTGPVSTFAVNTAAPSGVQSTFVNNFPSVQSTFAVNKTSTHISGQSVTVSTYSVGGVVTPNPASSGGLSVYRNINISTGAKQVKAGAGQIYGMVWTNNATSTRYLKFYDASSAAVGTTTPKMTIGLPSMSSFSNAVTGISGPGGMGIQFSTNIFVAATTGLVDNDTGAPASTEVMINVFYA